MNFVILPGLDGTGKLLAPFIDARPPGFKAIAVAYPEASLTFDAHVDVARAAILAAGDCILIAESFSGPVALALLSEPPVNLKGTVLVATFATVPWRPLARLAPALPGWLPRMAMRHAIKLFGVNGKGNEESARRVIEVVAAIPWSVLSNRIRLLTDQKAAVLDAKVPLLSIEPQEDWLVPRRSFASAEYDHAMRVKIEGPHMALLCKPYECWEAIYRFLHVNGLLGHTQSSD